MAKLKTIISSMLGLLLMLILSNFVSATNYTGYQLFDYLNGTSGDVKACAYCATTNWFNFTNSVPCTYVSSGYSSCTGTASVSGLIGMLVPASTDQLLTCAFEVNISTLNSGQRSYVMSGGINTAQSGARLNDAYQYKNEPSWTDLMGIAIYRWYRVLIVYNNSGTTNYWNIRIIDVANGTNATASANIDLLPTVDGDWGNISLESQVNGESVYYRNVSCWNGTFENEPIAESSSVDTTSPTIDNITNSSTNFKRYNNVTYNFTIRDETALSMAWIESNHTGILTNYSYTVISGTSAIVNFSVNISLIYNSVIKWRGCGNDSSNNMACTSIQSFTVVNTLPTVTQSSPIDKKTFNSGSINTLNFSTTYFDLDGTSGSCTLWINTTAYNSNTSVPNNTIFTLRNNATLNNGNYLWFINCSDGTNLANSSERLFRIDNQSAVFTWVNPLSTNTTKTKASSILVNISVVDNFIIDACLTRMFNTTSTIYNNLTINISASTFTALFTYILTGLPDGTYYIENSCNDTASFSPKIPHYTASKKTESIDFVDIPSGVNITLTIELHNPAGNPISMNGKNLILNATKDDAEEHILFGGTIDNLASPHTIKFIYSSNNNLPIKWIKASQFPAHIIVGNKFFHHKDLVTKGWNITQVGFEGNNFYLYFSKTSYNSTEDFDPITGEITVTTEVSSFVYDTTAPNISLNNPDNSANISTSIVDFNFTITDANTISNCSLYHNGTGTFALNKTLSSITNNTFTTISVSLLDGNYLWGIECTDEVGNINQSVNRTFLLDATSPKVNISIPANGAIVTIDSGSNVILNFYYNVTDINGIRNCTLYINNVVETSNTSVVKGVNSSFLNIIKSEGSYSWSVKCWDVFNNLQTSETFLFSVPSSDTIITTGGGGGGGGTVKEINESALLQSFLSVIAVCGNNKCDSGETLATCPKDCALLSSESFKGAIFAQFLLGFIIIVVVISLIVGAKKK